MKILVKHLEKFLNHKYPIEMLEDSLIQLGIEIEQELIYQYDKIKVVEIVNINPHPNADRLSLVTLSDGSSEIVVVCGATNIEIGQRVPLATAGTILGEMIIGEAIIRGVASSGMLCSASELNMSSAHSGIFILPNTITIGDTLDKYFDSPSLLDVKVTPNRPDWLGAYGVARDLSCLLQPKIISNKPVMVWEEKQYSKDSSLAQSYFIAKLENISNTQTPQIISDDLSQLDSNPKGNVLIDATNWSTLVFGQPLHAFDKTTIKGELTVRLANLGECLTLLDGKEIKLDIEDIVIADDTGAIALAGIMGGASTAITDKTNAILLEGASFDHKKIRKSVMRHNINSDASQRFEKGVDRQLAQLALEKTVEHISKNNTNISINLSGKVSTEIKSAYFDKGSLIKLAGFDCEQSEIDSDLIHLGFEKISNNQYNIPSWRFDIDGSEDNQAEIIEEIVRLHGIDAIASKQLSKQPTVIEPSQFESILGLKQWLWEKGFTENLSSSFISFSQAKELNLENLQAGENPISSETNYLRPNLLFGILKTLIQNPAYKSHLVYEIGQVFNEGFVENTQIIFACTKDKKNQLENVLKELGVDKDLQEIDPQLLLKNKIRLSMVCSLELKLSQIKIPTISIKKLPHWQPYRDYDPLPATVRDFAFWSPESIDIDMLMHEIRTQLPAILLIEQFDYYKPQDLDKVSIAVRCILQPKGQSFTQSNIDGIVKQIETIITDKGCELR